MTLGRSFRVGVERLGVELGGELDDSLLGHAMRLGDKDEPDRPIRKPAIGLIRPRLIAGGRLTGARVATRS